MQYWVPFSNYRIDGNGSIKVADFGLAEDVYTKTYFREDGSSSVLVPFKWMPPESLEEGVFSEKSDVVSHCFREIVPKVGLNEVPRKAWAMTCILT